LKLFIRDSSFKNSVPFSMMLSENKVKTEQSPLNKMPGNLYLLFFSFACPKEKNQKKKTPGSLACGYPCKIAFRGAKARANSLCEFFAIIDMLSKTDFWILMAESVYAVFPGRFHYWCHGHS